MWLGSRCLGWTLTFQESLNSIDMVVIKVRQHQEIDLLGPGPPTFKICDLLLDTRRSLRAAVIDPTECVFVPLVERQPIEERTVPHRVEALMNVNRPFHITHEPSLTSRSLLSFP